MSTEVKSKGHFRNHWGFYSLLVLSLLATSYVWFSGQIQKEELEKKHTIELQALKVKTDSLLQAQIVLSQALTAKTLAQAISTMSTDETGRYFDQLIMYKGIDEIAFEQTNKIINSSTNKSYLTKSLIDVLNVQMNYQNTDTQTFFQKDKTIICHPVITKGKIEGTLITVYPKVTI